MSKVVRKWKDVVSFGDAKGLIDRGVILPWKDVKRLASSLNSETHLEIIDYFANKLNEKNDARIVDEVLVENTMLWLHHNYVSDVLAFFLEKFVLHPNRERSSIHLVEVAFNLELSNSEHEDEIFATIVSITCELGLALNEFTSAFPGEIQNSDKLFDHFSTYLLSVSNAVNDKVRFSLVHYFGNIELRRNKKVGFNKIMNRFGYTLLDNLFQLLYHKKTESVALQYLKDNFYFFLQGDESVQSILHMTMKSYMLKNPERFTLFLSIYTRHFKQFEDQNRIPCELTFFHHMGALFRVANELNHKRIVLGLVECMVEFNGNENLNVILKALLKTDELRPQFYELIKAIYYKEEPKKILNLANRPLETKRGRRPSFAKFDELITLEQVDYLAKHSSQVLKVS